MKQGDSRTVTVRTHQTKRAKSLVLRIECADTVTAGDMRVRMNGADLRPGSTPKNAQIFPENIWPSSPVREKSLEFIADPSLLNDVNDLWREAGKALTLEWVSLGVMHR